MKNVFHTGVIESWKGKSWTEQLEVPSRARSGAVQTLPILLAWWLLNSKNYLKGFFFKKQANNDNFKRTQHKKKASLLFEYQWSVWFWSQFCYFLRFRFNLSSLSELHRVPTFPFFALHRTRSDFILFAVEVWLYTNSGNGMHMDHLQINLCTENIDCQVGKT